MGVGSVVGAGTGVGRWVGGATGTGVAAAGGIWKLLTSYTSLVTKFNIYLLVIEVVVTVVMVIYNYIKYELHAPSSEYTDMPSLLFESKTTSNGVRIIKYNAVTEPYRGTSAETRFAETRPSAVTP